MNKVQWIIFIAIFSLGAYFRFVGNNWDDGQHLHPDERFLTMVATSMKWPLSIQQFFNTDTSTLNPHNVGHGFYVYGTMPVILVKAIAEGIGKGGYNNLNLVGRAVSGVFDLGTLLLVFGITHIVSQSISVSLFAMFLYASAVLPIQLSHFYTTDPALVFFSTASVYLMLKKRFGVLLGSFLGLAVASKISAVLLFPVMCLSVLFFVLKQKGKGASRIILTLILMCISFIVVVRVAYPYAFTHYFGINPKIIANFRELKGFDSPEGFFPPSVQWITTKPIFYPLWQLIWYGMGLPLALFACAALPFALRIKHKRMIWILIVYTASIFIYQGIQYSKPLRYFYPMIPMLLVMTAIGSGYIANFFRTFKHYILFMSICVLIVYPIAFTGIYTRTHSRISASGWIYRNIPAGSIISGESWDDYLPVSLDETRRSNLYTIETIDIVGPDTPEKWEKITKTLARVEYVILSSNRAYGSMLTVPERYPITSGYYSGLFDGTLGFTKVAEFTSRPNIPIPGIHLCITPPLATYGEIAKRIGECTLPGISYVDDYADEIWTVYDHPKVIIFKKSGK